MLARRWRRARSLRARLRHVVQRLAITSLPGPWLPRVSQSWRRDDASTTLEHVVGALRR